MNSNLINSLVGEIKSIIDTARNNIAREVNNECDNKPIGIILCTDKDALTAEYAHGGLSNNIFASKYTYYIPQKEQLIAEVEKIIKRWEALYLVI